MGDLELEHGCRFCNIDFRTLLSIRISISGFHSKK